MIHVIQQRLKWRKDRTPSEVTISGKHICYVLEDELRELPGVPVAQWKIKDETAIPAGLYRLKLTDESKYGKETLVLEPTFDAGFTDLRIHGGNREKDTKGCPLTGIELDENDCIPGGKSQPALKHLKSILVPAIKRGEEVVWEVRNPPGYNGPPQEQENPLLRPLFDQS